MYLQEQQAIASAVHGLRLSWFTFRAKSMERIHPRAVGMTGKDCQSVGRLFKLLLGWTVFKNAEGGVVAVESKDDAAVAVEPVLQVPHTPDEKNKAKQRFKAMSAQLVADFCEERGANIWRKNDRGKTVNMYVKDLRDLASVLFEARSPIVVVLANAAAALQVGVALHNAFVVMNKTVHVTGDVAVKEVMQEVLKQFWLFDEHTKTDSATNIVVRRSLLIGSLALLTQFDYVGGMYHLDDHGGERNIQDMKSQLRATHGNGGPKVAAIRVSTFASIPRLGIPTQGLAGMDERNQEAEVSNMMDRLVGEGYLMVDFEDAARMERRTTRTNVYVYQSEQHVRVSLQENRAISVWHVGPDIFVQRKIDKKCRKLCVTDAQDCGGMVFVQMDMEEIDEDTDSQMWVAMGDDWSPAIVVSFVLNNGEKRWSAVGKDYGEWVLERHNSGQTELAWGWYYEHMP